MTPRYKANRVDGKGVPLYRGQRKSGEELLTGDVCYVNGECYIFPRTDDTPLNSPDWFEIDESTLQIETTSGEFVPINEVVILKK